MILTIEISDDDIKTLMNMSMTVEDMEETMEGRIACAICRSVNDDCEFNRKIIKRGVQNWLSSFDTSSATKCFEAVNILKERLEGEE